MRLWRALLFAAVLILLAVQHCDSFVDKSGWFTAHISFYSCSKDQGTADGITASGIPVFDGCAASYEGAYKLGTRLELVGWGEVIVADHGDGPASSEPWIDIFLSEAQGGRDMAFLLGRIKLYARIIG